MYWRVEVPEKDDNIRHPKVGTRLLASVVSKEVRRLTDLGVDVVHPFPVPIYRGKGARLSRPRTTKKNILCFH